MNQVTNRKPSMVEAFQNLLAHNFPIQYVIDVGVLSGTDYLIEAFPNKKHILVEPVAQHIPGIVNLYTKKAILHQIYDVALFDIDSEVWVAELSADASGTVTHSAIYLHESELKKFSNVVGNYRVRAMTLATLLKTFLLEESVSDAQFLVKIDVDGAEEKILLGIRDSARQISAIAIEMPIATFESRASLLNGLGYKLHEITDFCYYRGSLSQVDCLFVRQDTIPTYGLNPWAVSSTVDFSLWSQFRP